MAARESAVDALSWYLGILRDTVVLTKEQEIELIRRIRQGHRSALDQLIESNLCFVVRVAREYRGLGLPFEDLLNEGNIGLIEAARRFDPDRETRFITYAVWWIRKCILRAISMHAHIVRVPTYQLKMARELVKIERRLRNELGRSPRRDEISARLAAKPSSIDRLLQLQPRAMSLDEEVGEEESLPLVSLLEDVDAPTPEQRLMHEETRGHLAKALTLLTRREKFVIAHRFGLHGKRTMSLKALGRKLGISKERVRQVEISATHRLRRYFTRHRLVRSLGPTPGSPRRTFRSRRLPPLHH